MHDRIPSLAPPVSSTGPRQILTIATKSQTHQRSQHWLCRLILFLSATRILGPLLSVWLKRRAIFSSHVTVSSNEELESNRKTSPLTGRISCPLTFFSLTKYTETLQKEKKKEIGPQRFISPRARDAPYIHQEHYGFRVSLFFQDRTQKNMHISFDYSTGWQLAFSLLFAYSFCIFLSLNFFLNFCLFSSSSNRFISQYTGGGREKSHWPFFLIRHQRMSRAGIGKKRFFKTNTKSPRGQWYKKTYDSAFNRRE